MGASSSHYGDLTLKISLFGVVTLTKIVDIDKYHYSVYGTGFDKKSNLQVVDLVKM